MKTHSLLIALAIAFTVSLHADQSLKLSPGERLALVGGDLAVRLQTYGTFETLLHARFPKHQLVVRGLGWPADEPNKKQRPSGYEKYPFLDPMKDAAPDVVLCFFGFSESFRGEAAVKGFAGELENFAKNTAKKYPTKSGQAPRFVLVSPIAFENQRDTNRPEGVEQNKNLALYTAAAADAAKRAGAAFVDLFTPTQKLFAENMGAPLTVDGGHLNARGEVLVGQLLDAALFGPRSGDIPVAVVNPPPPARTSPGGAGASQGDRNVASPWFERLRAAVNDKNAHHSHDYRTVNSMYIYGGRREPFGDASYPPEFDKLRKMVAKRDERIWALARGEKVPEKVDDSDTGALPEIPTGFGQKDYSEPKELKFFSGAEGEKMFKIAPGLKVQLFASEEQFPELAKPVQINFDSRGRLWVSTMPSYPAWRPGDGPAPDDKLLILEDTDGDGRADKRTVFASGLHCPTGFEFWNGGVIVVDQPRLLFLKDTDGDDRADVREILFDGFGSDDTHHAIGAFEWSPGGSLQMLEGISLSTTIETIYGPLRENGAKNWILEPRSLRVTPVTIGSGANPWGFVHERWGQPFIGDGTSGSQTYYTPLTGKQFQGRKGLSDIRDKGFRPTVGAEFLVSRQFPDAMQGRYLVANVIGFQGIGAYEVREEGSGYAGKRLEDIIDSTDRNCRPVDPQIGPDGAIWFGDWHTPLIGHMQYSQRDPNRDHKHGRIYRVFAEGRPLLKPPLIAGAKVPALLDLLKAYEDRTRYRVRRELRDRPAAEVLAAVKAWVRALDAKDADYEHHLLEALWVTQGQRATDPALLTQLLAAKDGRARAVALQVLGDERASFPDALPISKKHLADEHPRARLLALRNLSFFDSLDAAEAALGLAGKAMDRYLAYTLQSTLGGLQPVWKPAFEANTFAAADGPGRDFLLGEFFGNAAKKDYKTALAQAKPKSREANEGIAALSAMRGKAEKGKPVFGRTCIPCHKVGAEGADLGPDLSNVGTRLTREKIYEAIFFPNDEVAKEYETVTVTLKSGALVSGFVAQETAQKLVFKIAGGVTQDVEKSAITKRESLKVSTMPEGLADTMAQPELIDLVEYLSSLNAGSASPAIPANPDVPAASKSRPSAVDKQKDGKIRINPTSPPSATAVPLPKLDPKKQPHIVFIAGDHEYRSETVLPMLARILQRDHGIKATMSYSVNDAGEIDPDNDRNQTNMDALKDADMAVLFVRWRKWPAETVRPLLEFAESGKPIVGFRTTHHGFQYANELGRELPKSEIPLGLGSLGDMNQPWTIRVFGQIFQGHNGPNSNTRVAIFEGAESHPVLRGVKPFTARSWMYRVSAKDWNGTEQFLLRGLSYDFNYGKNPAPQPFPAGKAEAPAQPVAWLRDYETTTGKRATTFFTSLGHPEEWLDENMRKLALNAILHLLGRELPAAGARADFAEPYEPGEVGVGPKYFKAGLKPRDLAP